MSVFMLYWLCNMEKTLQQRSRFGMAPAWEEYMQGRYGDRYGVKSR